MMVSTNIKRFVEVEGRTFHVQLNGPAEVRAAEGVPTLVYLNSLGSDLRIWDDVVRRLPELNHVRFDSRGHGLTDAPGGPYSIAELAQDLLLVMDELAIGGAIPVGISVGGLIAMRAALEAPERFPALVLCDTAAKIGTEEGWNGRIAQVQEQGLAAIAPAVVANWFSPTFSKTNLADYRGYQNMFTSTPEHGYNATCAALRDEDLSLRTPELKMPALLMCGEHDAATTPAQMSALASRLPASRYVEIEAAGHLPCIERPEEVAGQIAAFTREVAHHGA